MKKTGLLLFVASAPVVADVAYEIETVASNLEHPWSLAFMPNGQMLVTERPGRLRIIDPSGLLAEPVQGVPEVFASGQGGLHEVLLAEDFEASQELYLSFAYGNDDTNHTRVVRARFDGSALHDVTPIFTSQPAKSGDVHFGGRMTWMPDGTLLLGLGDGFFFREDAQKLDTHLAKMIRITSDGSVPEDNPFVNEPNVLPEIYSYGHRHIQGVVMDAENGVLYALEHGPRGGDEINVIEPGLNYGWPIISYGRDYSRALITPFTSMPSLGQPLVYWDPSIAPGGMTLYDGELFPEWRGSIFVAGMTAEAVHRVPLDASGAPMEQDVLFEEVGQRIRDVRTGPDGALYLLTDEEDGQVLRIVPAR